ncbi:cytochrome c oxidase assembly protein subunit 19 [Microdochium nivale]|nr:cytochrome c oxidase assembly protein subunit 19 [Microdochium nivale]
MSTFGSPGGSTYSGKPIPPERGSFPLDHDGECTSVMKAYLACIKKVKGVNEDQCRDIAKTYLSCRMDKNLMAKDEFKNLGFQDAAKKPETSPVTSQPEKGKKGELMW